MMGVELKQKCSETIKPIVKTKTMASSVTKGDTGQWKLDWKLTSATKIVRPSFHKNNAKM